MTRLEELVRAMAKAEAEYRKREVIKPLTPEEREVLDSEDYRQTVDSRWRPPGSVCGLVAIFMTDFQRT